MSDNTYDIDDILNEISKRHEQQEHEKQEQEQCTGSAAQVSRANEKESSAQSRQERPTAAQGKAESESDEKPVKRPYEKRPEPAASNGRPAHPHHGARETAPMAAWEIAYLDSVKDRRIDAKPVRQVIKTEKSRLDGETPDKAENPAPVAESAPPVEPMTEKFRFANAKPVEKEEAPQNVGGESENAPFEADEKKPVGKNAFEGFSHEDDANVSSVTNDKCKQRGKNKKENGGKRKKSKKGKIFLVIILVLVAAIIGTGGGLFLHVNNLLNKITDNSDKDSGSSKLEEWTGMDELIVNFNEIYETSDAASYRDMVKQWYYNGEPASSSNIYNVMLIGEDTRGDDIEEEGTRADSALIASVNTETGELVLSSILRDSYVYYEEVPGDESTGRYSKITEAMMYGGLDCYINAVERVFKVNIDNYVIVNFASFKTIIDTLGGVDIEMTAREIREINNNPDRYGGVYIEGDAGEKHLDGTQALAYCRIRYIDSDIVRADRQKTVLFNIFNELKEASKVQLASVVTKLLPYVKTGFSKQEILSLGEYAIKHGWLGYKFVTYTTPTNETKQDGTVITTCVGGYGESFYNQWCWKIDVPLASQMLQEKIYGKTNVILAENRPNFRNLSAY